MEFLYLTFSNFKKISHVICVFQSRLPENEAWLKKKNNWICFYVLKVMKADNAKLNSEPLLFRIACQSALQKVN